jgi:hypothetical protein
MLLHNVNNSYNDIFSIFVMQFLCLQRHKKLHTIDIVNFFQCPEKIKGDNDRQ